MRLIMTNTINTQELNMELVGAEIAGLSLDTRQFLNENFSAFMIAEDGTIVNRPPRAGARRSIVRPTDADRLVMETLIENGEATTGILQKKTQLDKKTVTAAIKYLRACTFVQQQGRGPSSTYQAATTNPVYPEHKQTVSRRSGPQTGPTARAAFITALNEIEPGSPFTLDEVQCRAIELFPASGLRKASFGAIPSQLVEGGHIMAVGNGRSRSFTMGLNVIPGAWDVPVVQVAIDDTVVAEDFDTTDTEDQGDFAAGQ